MLRTSNSISDHLVTRFADMDRFAASASEPARAPLPLPVVLRNIDALHTSCNGTHVCGLTRRFAFDLYHDYLMPLRLAASQ